ncbi:hypothetical protein IJC60_03180 [bacterium]|nr:hypothetical protein [bacterium]
MPQENSQTDMGKKIADALKAQNDADFEITEDLTSDDVLTDLDDLGLDDDSSSQEEEQESYTAENFDFDTEVEKASEEYDFSSQASNDEDDDIGYEPIFKVNQQQAEEHAELKLSIDAEESTDEFEMPNNINVLKNLVAKLPSGVPRQTGALIIRQTIEALGISMKNVLQDAQKAKDCLNSSIRDCAFTIQEYKTNIRNLEKQSLGYQRQLTKLNDIINLFVYTDKK